MNRTEAQDRIAEAISHAIADAEAHLDVLQLDLSARPDWDTSLAP